MSILLNQVLIYMTSTFLLGLLLGWVVWKVGRVEEREALSMEVEFWKNHLDQTRLERDRDISKIEALTKEQQTLKEQLAETGT